MQKTVEETKIIECWSRLGRGGSFSPEFGEHTRSLTVHVILSLLLIELTFLLGSCVLVLLVLRDEIVHVALCLRKFHLVHAFTRVPVQEGLATEHGCEELGHPLEHFLDRRGVPEEGNCHLQPLPH